MRLYTGIIFITGFIGLSARLSPASDQWILETGAFDRRAVSIQSIDASQLSILESGKTVLIPLANFLSLERNDAAIHTAGRWIARLSNGDRYSGEPVTTTGESLMWRSGLMGDVTLSLRDIVAIFPARNDPDVEIEPRKDDAVYLSNGDAATGVITALTATTITIDGGTGRVEIPLESVASVRLASTSLIAKHDDRSFRIALIDGSRVTAASLSGTSDNLSFKLIDGSQHTLQIDSMKTIEQLNGPVCFLSSLTPVANTQTPYFDTRWPAKMDHSVTGDPIRFKNQMFSHGIGVHARSRLVWEVPRDFHVFRTRYAIDGDRPLADVAVRILADDRIVHETSNFQSGKLSDLVAIDLKQVKTLTLEVDYGQRYDIQDHLNWIEPALVRQSPASP